MFESIRLEGFQVYDEPFRVVFSKGVTTICGDTDAGKSSIIRALYWLCTNRPIGNWMTRHGTSKVRVRVALSGGLRVTRSKGKKLNLYVAGGGRYKAFGPGKLPADVAALLAVDEVNFQHQGDPAFWFSDPPGKVSQELNRVVDLSVIDSSLANASAQVREATAAAKVCTARLERAVLDKSSLEWVPAMSERMKGLVELKGRADSFREDCAGLDKTIQEARRLASAREAYEGAFSRLSEIIEAGRQAVELYDFATGVQNCCIKIEQAERAAEYRPVVFDKFDRLLEQIDELEVDTKTLNYLIGSIGEEESCLETSKKSVTETRRRLRVMTEGRECPVCGNPFLSDSPPARK